MTRDTPARRPSPLALAALAVSLLSLLVAVGATSYAAGLARGSVGTPQLRAGAVTTPKVRDAAVTGAKVRDRSIGLGDLAPGARPTRGTHVNRTFAVGQGSVVLASVNGVAVTAACQEISPAGASARLGLRSDDPDASSAPLTSNLVAVRRDQGAAAPVVSTTGASLPFSGYDLSVNAADIGVGNASLDGVVQSDAAVPVRVEIGLSAIGAATTLRGCRFRVVLTPVS